MKHLILALLMIGVSPAIAKECPTPNLPKGVRVQLPPECDNPIRTGTGKDPRDDVAKADQGFVDLGSGTKVRVGGRVRFETGFQR